MLNKWDLLWADYSGSSRWGYWLALPIPSLAWLCPSRWPHGIQALHSVPQTPIYPPGFPAQAPILTPLSNVSWFEPPNPQTHCVSHAAPISLLRDLPPSSQFKEQWMKHNGKTVATHSFRPDRGTLRWQARVSLPTWHHLPHLLHT